jgi:hypothetical protein
MPLSWDARTRLLRLGGVAEELLASARAGREPEQAFAERVDALADEVQDAVADWDPLLQEELERVLGPPHDAPDLRAAALVGWLKAGLAAELLREQRGAAPGSAARRKQTVGFRIRSPVTREPQYGDESQES